MPVTPRIRLSLAEVGPMLVAFGVLSFRMVLTIFGRAPWRALGAPEKRRDYWREVALVMIRTGGYWLSIRHLQFMMPNTRSTCQNWGLLHRTPVYSENVPIADEESGDPNPCVHWIGAKPTRESLDSGRKVLLYLHGGGFVLPLSSGTITMITTVMKEANASTESSAYLAIAEYTIAPYARYPTQILQCISIIKHIHAQYGLSSSNLVLAGDSCGGSLALSLLSHYLHPASSPTLPPLPYTLHTSPPLAGILLISPWTSFATSSASYQENAERDTLPSNIIQRFRDTYIGRSQILPHAHENPLKVASLTGRQYKSQSDPPIVGLKLGVGAIRPLGSVTQGVEDDWWNDIGAAVSRMIITAGEYESFRDDILTCVSQIRAAANSGGNGSKVDLIVDESFHAVMVSDFSFPVPPSTLVANLSGWLVDTLRKQTSPADVSV